MAVTTSDVVHDLADLVVGAKYSKIPEDATRIAKMSVLDTLGVIVGASGIEPAARNVVDLVDEIGGRPEASVLGFGGKAPAVWAAFANGAMAHCLDFDDHTPWGQHAASSIVPAVFAVAERRGGIHGSDLVAAVAVGQDIFARMRYSLDWRKDWNFSTTMGVFAATAAACRVLDLSRSQTMNALGVASMQSSGVMETVFETGSDLHGIYAGFPAKGAVLATLLAERGTTGVSTLFEGKNGVFNTYFAGRYNREKMVEDLGIDYAGSTTLYKPWPSVGTSHGHIHATIEIVSQHDLRVEEIEEIRIHVGDHHNLMCRPLDRRRAPATPVDAKFSLPFLVAIAAVRRGMEVSDFSGEMLKDPQVLAVAQKVVPVEDETLDWTMEIPAGRVEIITCDGRRLAKVGDSPPGSAGAPLTWDEIARKFRNCAAASAVPLSVDQIENAQQLALTLESQHDATDLIRTLTPASVDRLRVT